MNPIEVKGLTFSYEDKPILKNIHTRFQKGKLTAIIGPNGSGKTTLVKLLSRLMEPERGTVQLMGRDIRDYGHREIGQRVAVVPQQTAIEFDYSVEDVVMMGRYPHLKRFQSEGERDWQVVQNAMAATDVAGLRTKSINALSGGELQRVIIARALAQEPEILILDEPISHLDVHHQLELLKLVRKLAQSKSLTVIMILHDLNFAMEFSDYVMMLKNGEVYIEGSPMEVITPGSIKAVYEIEVCLIENPITGNPYVIPISTT